MPNGVPDLSPAFKAHLLVLRRPPCPPRSAAGRWRIRYIAGFARKQRGLLPSDLRRPCSLVARRCFGSRTN